MADPTRDQVTARIDPGPPPEDPRDVLAADVWGFRDTAFRINSAGVVELTGTRYALSGKELPGLRDWAQEVLGTELRADRLHASSYPTPVHPPVANPSLRAALAKFLAPDAVSDDALVRLRHGHGHTQEEMYAIKWGQLGRVPDLVVWPSTHEHVEKLVDAARATDACLIPYGGGTNVSEALRCPPDEARCIVSVDMSRMNRILWIDPRDRMACIQAGAVGRNIAAQLAEHGFTLGHEPDSFEHSTLGGWIATRASGMKKNRYGNIEDLVMDLVAVTAEGTLRRSTASPRESIGHDPRSLLLGSEGNLGIVTQATVKIFPLPAKRVFDSVVFPSFEAGYAFLYDLAHEATPPASVRLMDPLQFAFGQALKPPASGFAAWKSKLERAYVTRVRGFEPSQIAACTLLFEGSASEVRAQRRDVSRLARRHGGLRSGASNGERGYQLTFSIAYIRDFVMNHFVLAESFETSVPWSRALALCANVKQRLRDEHARRGLPGRAFVSCRITQLYATGVCIYFYFAFPHDGVEHPSAVYAELERAARDEVLRCGGSLSHHHGVGKLRRRFLSRIMSPPALVWTRSVKSALDPGNLFAAGNLASIDADGPEGG
jgi:alkyldihydroxyacetonephosphate synthase